MWLLAKEMLHRQHQSVDFPAHTRTAHNGLQQKKLEEVLCWIICHVPPEDPVCPGTELSWTDEGKGVKKNSIKQDKWFLSFIKAIFYHGFHITSFSCLRKADPWFCERFIFLFFLSFYLIFFFFFLGGVLYHLSWEHQVTFRKASCILPKSSLVNSLIILMKFLQHFAGTMF